MGLFHDIYPHPKCNYTSKTAVCLWGLLLLLQRHVCSPDDPVCIARNLSTLWFEQAEKLNITYMLPMAIEKYNNILPSCSSVLLLLRGVEDQTDEPSANHGLDLKLHFEVSRGRCLLLSQGGATRLFAINRPSCRK